MHRNRARTKRIQQVQRYARRSVPAETMLAQSLTLETTILLETQNSNTRFRKRKTMFNNKQPILKTFATLQLVRAAPRQICIVKSVFLPSNPIINLVIIQLQKSFSPQRKQNPCISAKVSVYLMIETERFQRFNLVLAKNSQLSVL